MSTKPGQLHKVRGSVVLLTLLDAAGDPLASGTGFAIGPSLVATNYHVVEHATRLRATLADNTSVDVAAVVAQDEKNDLALLRLDGPRTLAPLTLGLGSIEPGDRVVVVGNPLGLAGTVSEGIVSAVRLKGLGEDSGDYSDRPLLQITAPISPGSSGSPVFNSAGEVIGIAVAHLVEGQNLNLAIPSRFLNDLRKAGDSHSLVRALGSNVSRWALTRNLSVSLVLFGLIFVAFRFMRPPNETREAGKTPRIRMPARRPRGWDT